MQLGGGGGSETNDSGSCACAELAVALDVLTRSISERIMVRRQSIDIGSSSGVAFYRCIVVVRQGRWIVGRRVVNPGHVGQPAQG